MRQDYSAAARSARDEILELCKQKAGQHRKQQPTTIPGKTVSGKVSLVAIVHHQHYQRPDHEEGLSSWSSRKGSSSNEDDKQQQQKQQQQQQQRAETSHSNGGHHKQESANEKTPNNKSKGRLARLFSRASSKQKEPALVGDEQNKKKKKEKKEEVEKMDNIELEEFFSNQNEQTIDHATSSASSKPGEVIEFKFDLIVDSHHPEDSIQDPTAAPPALVEERKLRDQVNELVESLVFDSNDVCLMSTGSNGNDYQRRMNPQTAFERLFQLTQVSYTYAFELLRAAANCERVRKETAGQRAAGDILDAREKVTNKEVSKLNENDANGDDPEDDSNQARQDYSIEMGATLFLDAFSSSGLRPEEKNEPPTHYDVSEHSHFIDLLHERSTTTSADNKQQTLLECWSIEEASKCLHEIKSRMSQLSQATNTRSIRQELLLVTLKLKQKINTGLFSNRMWLIDFQTPNQSELKPIIESIFSGQALAHLRRRAHHLEALEREEEEDRQNINNNNHNHNNNSNPNRRRENILHTENETNTILKHHHAASSSSQTLAKLIQAEWLLYKQLSSALIRTLILVHVQKLAKTYLKVPSATNSTSNNNNLNNRLLEHNLELLKFARDIQRASARRLKRRQRHLARTRELVANEDGRSMMVQQYNLCNNHRNKHNSLSSSVVLDPVMSASNLSLGGGGWATSSSSNEAPPRQLDSDLVVLSTPLRYASNHSARRQRNTCRHCETLSSNSNHHRSHCSANKRTKHHNSHQHHQHQHLHRHHHQSHSSEDERRHALLARIIQATTASQCRSTSARSDSLALTESSSLVSSESSGQQQQAAKQAQRSWWSKYQQQKLNDDSTCTLIAAGGPSLAPIRAQHQQLAMFTSDTEDSLASACLNSCGSSSKSNAMKPQHQVGSMICRREVELRWLNKQRQQASLGLDSGELLMTSILNREDREPPSDPDGHEEEEGEDDERSVVVVAEPPRQLKLEKFLNQLNTIVNLKPEKIGDRSQDDDNDADSQNHLRLSEMIRQASSQLGSGSVVCKEDDEDCKSHSSILEHLSSLAFESKQKQQLQQHS